MLKDSFGRIHDYLRISLTDKCNLRCVYCHPANSLDGHHDYMKNMSAAEIEKIVSIFVEEGVNKIRLTGGEPLIRKDAKEIIERLSKFPVKLTITTNGVFINEFIATFKQAKLKSVNVSLDSLNKEKNFSLNKRDEFDRVKNNIDLLLKNDFHVKVNVVVMNGINSNEVIDFIDWTKEFPLHIRFIEFMPFPGNKWDHEKVFTHQQILKIASEKYVVEKLSDDEHDTAKKYFVPNHKGTFAVISTMSEPFCSGCNRLRITTDGKMRSCLFSKTETDLLSALRAGNDITPLIRENLYGKHYMLGGNNDEQWGEKETASNRRSMLGIGG